MFQEWFHFSKKQLQITFIVPSPVRDRELHLSQLSEWGLVGACAVCVPCVCYSMELCLIRAVRIVNPKY